MSTTSRHDASYGSTLPVTRQNQGIDSPGSSVFDLPIQTSLSPQERTASRQLQHIQTDPLTFNDGSSATEPVLSFVVISGGTGGNAICSAFGNASHYILPVSDDGGSSSEIIRVLGGPSIGQGYILHYSPG